MLATDPKYPNGGCGEEVTALQIHSPGLQCVGKSQGPPRGLGSPVSVSFPPWDGGGDRQEENNSSGIHTQLSMEFREKKNSFSRQPLRQGHKGLGEILHWVVNFHNPIAKTALRKFPRRSKWTQKLRQGMPGVLLIPLHQSTCPASLHLPAHQAARAPRGAAPKAPQILLCLLPGALQGLGREQGTPLTHGSDLEGFPRDVHQPPPHSVCPGITYSSVTPQGWAAITPTRSEGVICCLLALPAMSHSAWYKL